MGQLSTMMWNVWGADMFIYMIIYLVSCPIYHSRTRACLAIHKFHLDSNEVWLSMLELRCHGYDQSKMFIERSLPLVHGNNDHYKYCRCY